MAIRSPPATWSTVSGSERRITASTAATNGCRFVASVALAGADPVDRAEPEHVRQHERAERREDEERPDLPAEVPVSATARAGVPTRAISTHAAGTTIALTREGEYVRISGAMTTE